MTSDELKYAAEYHRGYEDGKHAKSADEWRLARDREDVVRRLRKMTIDSNYYGNIQRIALAIGTEYDGESFASECMRDRLIYLLGGDDTSSVPLSTYDVLGNERHKAVCRLEESKPLLGMTKTEILGDLGKAITDAPDFNPTDIDHLNLMWSTLIYLLGGDERNFSTAEIYTDAGEAEPNPAETREEPSDHVSFGTHSITAELREWMRIVLTDDDPAYAIADRIDQAHADAMQSIYDELANELAKTKELLEISYAKRRAYKLHIDQMKGGSKKWRKRYEHAQTLAEVNEQECAELLELLRDAAEDYRKLQDKYDMREGVLDAAIASLKDCVVLPKDRDGVTWSFGDRFTHKGKTYEVSAMRLFETGGWGLETSECDGNFNPVAFTHAHTAEEIVRDLTLGRITEKEAVELIEELRNE